MLNNPNSYLEETKIMNKKEEINKLTTKITGKIKNLVQNTNTKNFMNPEINATLRLTNTLNSRLLALKKLISSQNLKDEYEHLVKLCCNLTVETEAPSLVNGSLNTVQQLDMLSTDDYSEMYNSEQSPDSTSELIVQDVHKCNECYTLKNYDNNIYYRCISDANKLKPNTHVQSVYYRLKQIENLSKLNQNYVKSECEKSNNLIRYKNVINNKKNTLIINKSNISNHLNLDFYNKKINYKKQNKNLENVADYGTYKKDNLMENSKNINKLNLKESAYLLEYDADTEFKEKLIASDFNIEPNTALKKTAILERSLSLNNSTSDRKSTLRKRTFSLSSNTNSPSPNDELLRSKIKSLQKIDSEIYINNVLSKTEKKRKKTDEEQEEEKKIREFMKNDPRYHGKYLTENNKKKIVEIINKQEKAASISNDINSRATNSNNSPIEKHRSSEMKMSQQQEVFSPQKITQPDEEINENPSKKQQLDESTLKKSNTKNRKELEQRMADLLSNITEIKAKLLRLGTEQAKDIQLLNQAHARALEDLIKSQAAAGTNLTTAIYEKQVTQEAQHHYKMNMEKRHKENIDTLTNELYRYENEKLVINEQITEAVLSEALLQTTHDSSHNKSAENIRVNDINQNSGGMNNLTEQMEVNNSIEEILTDSRNAKSLESIEPTRVATSSNNLASMPVKIATSNIFSHKSFNFTEQLTTLDKISKISNTTCTSGDLTGSKQTAKNNEARDNSCLFTSKMSSNDASQPKTVTQTYNELNTSKKQQTSNSFNEKQWSNHLLERNRKIDSMLAERLTEIKKPAEVMNTLILPDKESEEWYDLKYIRESYDVFIFSNGFDKFKTDVTKRHKEISRSTGISENNIIATTPMNDFSNNSIYYRLELKTLNDFIKALSPWSEDAFTCGVKSTRAPINFLRPVIHDFDRNINLKSQELVNTIKNVEKYWSVSNLERIQYKDQKNPKLPEIIKNKLTCKFAKLSLLAKALKNGILLDATGTTHDVSFGALQLVKVCNKCGLQECNEKNCRETSCFKCGGEHNPLSCTNTIKCRNCGGQHYSNSDLCPQLIISSIQSKQNKFIVNFLLNEGIISSPLSVFKTRLTQEEFDNQCCERNDEQNILIDKIVENVMQNIKPTLNEQSLSINTIKQKVDQHAETLSNHENRISAAELTLNKFAKIEDLIIQMHAKTIGNSN